ncbi:hypothetical protein [Streptomyces sp. SID7909]|uniref:hypothetical protein n=1 Tax=Streptomyces sp. SID7909 TaxID=2706092 RepID=UPI0013BE33C0|nr:hypothetical protein [Streptomyces sp. SID7909]NEC08235.1 hypothetical protein [Streptomyces sp. SID7909]
MPRNAKKARRLVADGHTYRWTLRHRHDDGGPCRQILTLHREPGGPLRIVFTEGPNRYVPGGALLGSGDVGFVGGASLNLHEPGAVRALLDAAKAHGWQPSDRRRVEMDGWTLLEAAAAPREQNAGQAPHHVHGASSASALSAGLSNAAIRSDDASRNTGSPRS